MTRLGIGHSEVASLLLDAGAETPNDWTKMMVAVITQNLATVINMIGIGTLRYYRTRCHARNPRDRRECCWCQVRHTIMAVL